MFKYIILVVFLLVLSSQLTNLKQLAGGESSQLFNKIYNRDKLWQCQEMKSKLKARQNEE